MIAPLLFTTPEKTPKDYEEYEWATFRGICANYLKTAMTGDVSSSYNQDYKQRPEEVESSLTAVNSKHIYVSPITANFNGLGGVCRLPQVDC
jgi:hypothetical protein